MAEIKIGDTIVATTSLTQSGIREGVVYRLGEGPDYNFVYIRTAAGFNYAVSRASITEITPGVSRIAKGATIEWRTSVNEKPVIRKGVIEKLGDKELSEESRVYVRANGKLYVIDRKSIIK